MQKRVLKQLQTLKLGDLVRCEWCDASVGRSMSSRGEIDVPVKSWGIYLGVLGKKNKHIILAQNNFHYTNGVYDVDYTAIPLTWALRVEVLHNAEVCQEDAQCLLHSFLMGRSRSLKRRTNNHGA